MGWPVMIGDWSVPMWVTWIGLVVPGGLAFFGLKRVGPPQSGGPVIINHASEDQEPERSRQIARPPSHEIAKSRSLLP